MVRTDHDLESIGVIYAKAFLGLLTNSAIVILQFLNRADAGLDAEPDLDTDLIVDLDIDLCVDGRGSSIGVICLGIQRHRPSFR